MPTILDKKSWNTWCQRSLINHLFPLPHYNVAGLNSIGKQTTLHGVGGGGDVNLYISVSTILSKIVASCITSVDVHQLFKESCRSTITIENLLHFLKYFDENKIYIKIFFQVLQSFPPLIYLLFFCTNAERFG